MPIQSPAKDLRKTSAGALFGQGREMGSAQPSERPSQGLCSDRGAKRSQNSPPKDLEKPFKGRCAVADPVSRYSGASGQKTRGAPAMRMLPLFGKRTPARDRKGARGSVRAMPEHSTCRDDAVVTDEHSHPATRERCYWRAPHLTCVRWEPIGYGRRCPLAWARHPLLTSTARTAIHVVHVGFGLPGTVVLLVGTSLNLLSLVDSLGT